MFKFLREMLNRRGSGAAARSRLGGSLRLEALEDRLTPSTTSAAAGHLANGGVGTIGHIYYHPFVVSGNNLFVYGTPGNDSFNFTAGTSTNTVTLNGASVTVNPSQIRNIYFYGKGGTDTATLTDNLHTSSAAFWPHFVNLGGPNYFVSAGQTTFNDVFGTGGGSASFFDSAGNDTFYSGGRSAGMYDSGNTYLNSATGFSHNYGYSRGGTDTAQFFDTAGNDVYTAGQGYAGMHDSGNTYSNYATGFAVTHGYSSRGGTDTAYLSDADASGILRSPGGSLIANVSDATLLGDHYNNTATGFSDVEAISHGIDDLYYYEGLPTYRLDLIGNWDQG
jgi:hypothetical protein